MRVCSFAIIAISILAGGPAYGQPLFDYGAVDVPCAATRRHCVPVTWPHKLRSTASTPLATSSARTSTARSTSTDS